MFCFSLVQKRLRKVKPHHEKKETKPEGKGTEEVTISEIEGVR